jgi:phosphoribosylamine--glycine ligase
MKVLVIGSGGREHAIVWKLSQSKRVKHLYALPGNAGMAKVARCIEVNQSNISEILNFAEKEGIDLTVVGPEAPLAEGIVDRFKERDLNIFGPCEAAARLEESKVFAKKLMQEHGIPTANCEIFTDADEAKDYVREIGTPIVVKADGLAMGKGVIVADNIKEAEEAIFSIMEEKIFGSAGDRVIIEECLQGEEVSMLAFTDGENIVSMPSAQDHKRIFDGDRGPNTGGMGAYSPSPFQKSGFSKRVMEEVFIPVIRAMKSRGTPYVGVLYAGLMVRNADLKVLEFNVRFGDPETQPLLMRLKGDLVDIIEGCISGKLKDVQLDWHDNAAVCVVMAAKGYPGKYEKGKKIYGLEEVAKLKDVHVFHAGTSMQREEIITSGGRVLGVTAMGRDIEDAINKAYEAVSLVKFEGAYYRKDIGAKALFKRN